MFDLNSVRGRHHCIDGKVHIYDLYINKYNPICVQAVVPKKKAKLNHISLNQTHLIIIVGDSKG